MKSSDTRRVWAAFSLFLQLSLPALAAVWRSSVIAPNALDRLREIPEHLRWALWKRRNGFRPGYNCPPSAFLRVLNGIPRFIDPATVVGIQLARRAALLVFMVYSTRSRPCNFASTDVNDANGQGEAMICSWMTRQSEIDSKIVVVRR